ncbi:MAG: tellurium resistance protein TerC [bacterium]|nr:tellurium resistance protein TerC [bacterium]
MHNFIIIIQLIFLEGVLSIDNAAVLGALASTLPADKPIPFPRQIQFLRGMTNRLLGKQQAAALKIGVLMAYAGRALMLLLAQAIKQNPILATVRALYLIRLSVQNLKVNNEAGDTAVAAHAAADVVFWIVVLQIELTDLALSLDNVVAAVSLSSKMWVVMLGVALGILTMRFAASGFTWLITREPIIETAAYIIILNLGVELLLTTNFGLEVSTGVKFLVSAITLLACLLYAHLPPAQRLRPLLHRLGRAIGVVDQAFSWLFLPFSRLAALIGTRFRS